MRVERGKKVVLRPALLYSHPAARLKTGSIDASECVDGAGLH